MQPSQPSTIEQVEELLARTYGERAIRYFADPMTGPVWRRSVSVFDENVLAEASLGLIQSRPTIFDGDNILALMWALAEPLQDSIDKQRKARQARPECTHDAGELEHGDGFHIFARWTDCEGQACTSRDTRVDNRRAFGAIARAIRDHIGKGGKPTGKRWPCFCGIGFDERRPLEIHQADKHFPPGARAYWLRRYDVSEAIIVAGHEAACGRP